jgi:hypothetical protein
LRLVSEFWLGRRRPSGARRSRVGLVVVKDGRRALVLRRSRLVERLVRAERPMVIELLLVVEVLVRPLLVEVLVVLEVLLARARLIGDLWTTANGTERLALELVNLTRVGPSAPLQVQVLTDCVIK